MNPNITLQLGDKKTLWGIKSPIIAFSAPRPSFLPLKSPKNDPITTQILRTLISD